MNPAARSSLEAAEAGRTRFYLAHLLFIGALTVLVPAVLGLAELVGERKRSLARRGRVLVMLGIVGMAIRSGTDPFHWQLVASPADHTVALTAIERIGSSVGVLGPTFLLAAGVAPGFVMLALGLHCAGAAGRGSTCVIALAVPSVCSASRWRSARACCAGSARCSAATGSPAPGRSRP